MSTDTLREQIRAQVRTAVGAAKATATDASIAALMQRFEAGYAAVNAEAIVACFAPDVVWTLPDARVLNGRAACLAFLKERFASPAGPQFSDSHMHVLGQTVVQNYKVRLPLPGGRSVTLDGTDVYQIRDGLIARKDAYWKQIGAAQPAALAAAPTASGAATPAVVVPLRVGSAAGAQALTELYKRLAASPALLRAAQTGVLRFDLALDEGLAQGTSAMAATTAIDPAACCPSCKEGKACECKGDHCGLHEHKGADAVPELKGVIGERLLKTLPPGVKTVRLHPRAVVTPLGKEALRKRGITIDRGAQP
jgi:ketosteroid isomerase-like protein